MHPYVHMYVENCTQLQEDRNICSHKEMEKSDLTKVFKKTSHSESEMTPPPLHINYSLYMNFTRSFTGLLGLQLGLVSQDGLLKLVKLGLLAESEYN